MAFTYTVQDAVNLLSAMGKGVPLSSIQLQAADMASSDMYTAYPWRWAIAQIAAGSITLSDGLQDYNAPPNIYGILRGRIVRTDVSPNDYRDLDVQDQLVPDLTKTSYTAIRAISHEAAAGILRLEAAVEVSGTMTLEIQGEYQIMPTKITALSQNFWFPDQYFQVYVECLMYWLYKLTDDARAGAASENSQGRMVYSGQLGIYRSALKQMMEAEDFGADEQMFPERSLGEGKWSGNLSIYGV